MADEVSPQMTRPERPNEHDVVRVKGEPKPGTVVHIYRDHVAYEVEFDRRIVYTEPDEIQEILWRSEDQYG